MILPGREGYLVVRRGDPDAAVVGAGEMAAVERIRAAWYGRAGGTDLRRRI
jgi:hypothetical protein